MSAKKNPNDPADMTDEELEEAQRQEMERLRKHLSPGVDDE